MLINGKGNTVLRNQKHNYTNKGTPKKDPNFMCANVHLLWKIGKAIAAYINQIKIIYSSNNESASNRNYLWQDQLFVSNLIISYYS